MAQEQQGQEKTEEATPRKIDKAREEGQLARSRELNSVAIVTFGALAAIMLLPGLASEILAITKNLFALAGNLELSPTLVAREVAQDAMVALLPYVGVMFVAGVASSVMVGGMIWAPKALMPKASRMSLKKGFGRMFSMKSMVELAKSIAKFLLVSGVAIAALSLTMSDLLVLGSLPINSAIAQGAAYVGWSLLAIGLALIVVAAIDVPFQIHDNLKQLKMTKQEVKDEMKDSEGKPEIKAKIRALQQQVSRRKMLEEVPDADVIITNPEHFSVAIKYDSERMGAPMLLAKGVDDLAFRIREVANHHEVPLVAAPVLARAVYYNTQPGEEIPEGLYASVAQVLAYVYQLESYRRGHLESPPHLGSIEVPEDLTTQEPSIA